MVMNATRWVSILFFFLVISFLISCKQDPKAAESFVAANNLQPDGYGHIDDSVIYEEADTTSEQSSNENENEKAQKRDEYHQLTCEDIKKDPKQLVCGDNKTLYLCHVPPGNPLNSHVIKVNINALKGHKKHSGDFPLNCSDEYLPGQNCPYIRCDGKRFVDRELDEKREYHEYSL